jgi:hypothetical protein
MYRLVPEMIKRHSDNHSNLLLDNDEAEFVNLVHAHTDLKIRVMFFRHSHECDPVCSKGRLRIFEEEWMMNPIASEMI